MGNWREHAERAEWMKIETFRLSDADRAELFELLRRIVPKRERGHGIETYEGFITPQEACSATELQAACLVHQLEREQEREARRVDYNCPLAEPVEFAIATVKQQGFKYEGYRGTFLYWHRLQDRWLQIPGNIGAAIVTRRHDMLLSIIDYPKSERVAATRRSVAWDSLYPWRICNSIARLFQIHAFEPNTPLWHALSIFDWYELHQEAVDLTGSDDGDYPVEDLISYAVESAFEIGRHYEALRKKPFEPHALHGQKFPSGTTDKATEVHKEKAQHRADQVLFAARAVLQSGLGRKQNGNINSSKLAEEIALKYSEALNIRIGESRIAQIIKKHILSDKLK